MQGPPLARPLIRDFDVRYHTGSLAFGSLILAIVQIIRVMLEYLDQRLKGANPASCGFSCRLDLAPDWVLLEGWGRSYASAGFPFVEGVGLSGRGTGQRAN